MTKLKTFLKRLGILLLRLLALGLVTVFLALLIVPQFIGCRCGGSLTACKSNLKNIGTALEMYSTDWHGHYPRNLNQLVPNYLRELPDCPSAGRMTYRADFGLQAPGNTGHFEDYYCIECAGDWHTSVALPPNYPRYNGIEGLVDPPDTQDH